MERLDRATLRRQRALPTPALLLALGAEVELLMKSDTGDLAIAARAAGSALTFYTIYHRDERAVAAAQRVRRVARAMSRATVGRRVRVAAWRVAFLAGEAATRFPALRPRPRQLTPEERADRDLFNPPEDQDPEAAESETIFDVRWWG